MKWWSNTGVMWSHFHVHMRTLASANWIHLNCPADELNNPASRALQYSHLLSVNALIYFPWQKAVLVTISIWLLKTCFRDGDDMNKVSVSNLLDRQHVFVSWAPSAVISAPYFLKRSWIEESHKYHCVSSSFKWQIMLILYDRITFNN